MLTSSTPLLEAAQRGNFALGGFNVYNAEGVLAVVGAAEALHSAVILQVHPAALKFGGTPLLALCMEAALSAAIPVSVHLDHSASLEDIQRALAMGVLSIMADGSHLPYAQNVAFTREVVELAHQQHASVEAELGRLTGTEDDQTVEAYEARLTDPSQAAAFVRDTGIDALAVCIGNVHGHYKAPPQLDFARLEQLQALVSVPLVLHGASGLPAPDIQRCIALGVRKFNVNTELREGYVSALGEMFAAQGGSPAPELLDLLKAAVKRMENVCMDKIVLFRMDNKRS